MDLGIKGKIAFVGGSSSGLGEAVAKSLALEGVNVILSARDQKGLDRVSSEIRNESDVEVFTVQADFSKPADLERVVRETLMRFGHVDILFNNTGGPPSCRFEETTADMWTQSYRMLLMSVVTLTQGFLHGMKERKWGRIICSTSIAVKQPVENLILSNSVRASVTGFARTLANEVATSGITVNCVLPGYTMTQRLDYLAKKATEIDNISYKEAIEKWTGEIPMKRIGDPKEFADVVTFLASERASYVTGQSLAIDGGWVRSLL
ncbi:MAG: SDR family oxidoreductase [Clostridia bacterium]|nr:SDR family oxidoreductase [Clostridia bacterium]